MGSTGEVSGEQETRRQCSVAALGMKLGHRVSKLDFRNGLLQEDEIAHQHSHNSWRLEMSEVSFPTTPQPGVHITALWELQLLLPFCF